MTKKKVMKVSELPVFRSMSIFTTELTRIVIGTQRDVKQTYGYELINKCLSIIKTIRHCYKAKGTDKLEYASDMIGDLEYIEFLVKLLFELKEIDTRKMSQLSQMLADLLIQSRSWIESIENRTVNSQ